MEVKKIELAGKKVMPFTIPSGIIMTDVACAERMLKRIPEIGIWTTKSIGVKERTVPEGDEVAHPIAGKEYGLREPILAQIDEGTFVNAVKLANPGKDNFRARLLAADIPKDRVINLSVFGGSVEEVVSVIETLDDVVTMHEINGSCPHSEKGGMLIGKEPGLVYEFTKAAVGATKKPVLFKLTPNTDEIGELARAVKEAGGYGIVAINTVGPYIRFFDGFPVLTSEKGGGISGRGILERGLGCVRETRQAVGKDFFIMGMAGIGTARDVMRYRENGADAVGIGTRLVGMVEDGLVKYFPTLVSDIENGTNNAEGLLEKVDMQYRKVKIRKRIDAACDFRIFQIEEDIQAEPGQFVFAWIPEVGEKPFSVMDDNPFTIGVLERGPFTKKLNSLKQGDEVYIRGPYGRGASVPRNSNVVLVGGGCGIAGLHLLAKKLSIESNVLTLLAAKDREHLAYAERFAEYGAVRIATEDGSLGKRGLVTDLIRESILISGSYFFNCGPRAMVEAVLPLELEVSAPERVYSSVDYMTSCGVGICGKCVDKRGRRTCVEGPFMNSLN